MTTWRNILLGTALALATTAANGAAALQLTLAEVTGTELRLGFSDGRTLAREQLVGVQLDLADEIGAPVRVRVDAVMPDPKDRTGEVLLYSLTTPAAGGGWQPVCDPDPDGKQLGILQQGENGRVVIWCTSGALGKCVRFGYHPWGKAPDGTPLAPYHRACSNLVRGAYADPDTATTRNGMLIDIYDSIGIQQPDGEMPFEAAWDENGAVCVAHVRVPQNISLERLVEEAPRLAGRTGAACTEETAKAMGRPLLFNRSRGDGIPGR